MIADDSDFSSDSKEEEELEWLYIQCSFCNKREMGQKFNIEECDEVRRSQKFNIEECDELIAYVMDSK